jgi:hypothetical protein
MPACSSESLIESGEQFPVVGAEGRRFARYQFRALATATIYPPAGRVEERPQVCYVLTRDLSRGGISILHPTRLAHHQRIDLELSDGRKLTLGVQWIKRLGRHSYCIGCQFVAIDKST